MILLDVSWAKLLPKELQSLSLVLSRSGANIRNLNLSYNMLDFEFESPGYDDSEKFMTNIMEFFRIATFVNHINFSGMNFKKPQIL